MNYYAKFITYLKTPSKCYIPKCKAECCTNVPLPEGFVESKRGRIQRPILYAAKLGKNSPSDDFDSFIYNTTQNPIQLMRVNGKIKPIIPPEILEKMDPQPSDSQIAYLRIIYKPYENYCPFMTKFRKCAVYEERPAICREYGTLTDKQNQCSLKASPLEIIKDFIEIAKFALLHPFKNPYK